MSLNVVTISMNIDNKKVKLQLVIGEFSYKDGGSSKYVPGL